MESASVNELATALAKAQGKISAAAKSKVNPFFKSNYADLPAIWEACRTALTENGLSVVQAPQFEGNEIWLETTLIHSSGQWMRSRYPVQPTKPDPQGVGSAFTYARRYALAAMVGVVADDEDDDGNAASGRDTKAPAPKPSAPGKDAAPDRKAAAKQWAVTAEKAIRDTEASADLNAWESANEKAIVALAKVDETAHRQVVDALADQYERLNPIGA